MGLVDRLTISAPKKMRTRPLDGSDLGHPVTTDISGEFGSESAILADFHQYCWYLDCRLCLVLLRCVKFPNSLGLGSKLFYLNDIVKSSYSWLASGERDKL